MRLQYLIFLLVSATLTHVSAHSSRHARGLNTPKIDTHSHIYPDFYRDAVIAAGWVPGPDGNSAPPNWTVEAHLDSMNINNIAKAYLSCSSPGTVLYPNDTAAGVALTQQVNNYTASLKRKYPSRFGFFASLPLPSISDSLAEIDRALSLQADGFVFLSNAFGLYPGDPQLTPIYNKLAALNTTIFFHPTSPCPINAPKSISGTARLNYIAPLQQAYQAPTMEFIFDTTRAVSDLLLTGTASRFPSLRFLIPHCGAALPSLLDRVVRITSILGPKIGSDRPAPVPPQNLTTILATLNRQFWFDLAGFSMGNQIFAMRRLFGPERFLYGSDYPFTATPAVKGLLGEMNATLPMLFSQEEIELIFKGNAEGFLGKL